MLRSMIIGLAIAALLQVGVQSFSPAAGLSLASNRIDWVAVQADAVTHLIDHGFTLFAR
jgi:hypothetical protein